METLRNGAISISVPLYPRLKQIRNEQAELQKTIDTNRRQAEAVNLEAQQLAQQPESYSVETMEERARTRAKLEAQYKAFDLKARTAEAQLQRLNQEYAEWLANFGGWLYRKELLARELANAHEGDGEVFDMIIERDAPRTREQIKYELTGIIRKLAAFSGDQSLAAEISTLEA